MPILDSNQIQLIQHSLIIKFLSKSHLHYHHQYFDLFIIFQIRVTNTMSSVHWKSFGALFFDADQEMMKMATERKSFGALFFDDDQKMMIITMAMIFFGALFFYICRKMINIIMQIIFLARFFFICSELMFDFNNLF